MWALQIYRGRYAEKATSSVATATWTSDKNSAMRFSTINEAETFIDIHVPVSLLGYIRIVEIG